MSGRGGSVMDVLSWWCVGEGISVVSLHAMLLEIYIVLNGFHTRISSNCSFQLVV